MAAGPLLGRLAQARLFSPVCVAKQVSGVRHPDRGHGAALGSRLGMGSRLMNAAIWGFLGIR